MLECGPRGRKKRYGSGKNFQQSYRESKTSLLRNRLNNNNNNNNTTSNNNNTNYV
jgi:hypothetical protein